MSWGETRPPRGGRRAGPCERRRVGPGFQPPATRWPTAGGAHREGGGRARVPTGVLGWERLAGQVHLGGDLRASAGGFPRTDRARVGRGLRRLPVSTCCWRRSAQATG